jgi:sec-independent protein translocase protein TatB
MFENLNFWEIGVLLLLALFIFGPERLPKVIGDGLRMLRGLREMARNATRDLSREMGTDINLEDLHPKTFIRKHLLSEEDEAQIRRPFEDAFKDVKQITADANEGWQSDQGYSSGQYGGSDQGNGQQQYGAPPGGQYGYPETREPQQRNIDSDAT